VRLVSNGILQKQPVLTVPVNNASERGDSMYVTSYGKVEIRTSVPAGLSGTDHLASGSGLYSFASIHAVVWPYANTGVVWKITKINANTNTNTTNTASTPPPSTT
jgi:hypothetical protein